MFLSHPIPASIRRIAILVAGCLILTLFAFPLSAQETTPEPDVETFDGGLLTFDYPAGWTVEAPSVNEIVITGDEIDLFLQLVQQESPPDLTELLLTIFSEQGYSDPEPITLTEVREGVMIQDEYEHVLAYLLDDEHYVLLFVTADEATREMYTDEVMLIAGTMRYGDVPEASAESTAEPVVVPLSELWTETTTSELDFLDGTLTLEHPAEWFVFSAGTNELYLTDEEETFAILILGDMEFVFDMLGIDGNPNSIRRPIDLITALDMPSTEEYALGDYDVVRLDISDETGDTALLAVAIAPRTIMTVMFLGDEGDLERLDDTLNAILASMVYDAE